MLSSVRYSFYQKQKRQLLVKVYISLLFWEHSFLFLLSSDSTAFPGASICGGSLSSLAPVTLLGLQWGLVYSSAFSPLPLLDRSLSLPPSQITQL